MKIKAKKDDTRLISGDGIHHSGLEKRQKVLSVVFLVHHLLLFINFTFFFFHSGTHNDWVNCAVSS